MKSHKTKATELIELFHPLCGGMEPMQIENAKKCALALIDELLKSQPSKHMCAAPGFVQYPVDYWNEVRKEIINFES